MEGAKDSMTTNNRLSHLENQLNSIDKKLSTVVEALVGNDLTKQGGVIAQIAVLETRVRALEMDLEKEKEFRKKLVYGLAGITVLITAVTYVFTNWIK